MEQIKNITSSLFKANILISRNRLKGISLYSSVAMQLNYYAALLVFFWLPLSKQYITYFIALWVLTWLLEGNFIGRFKYSAVNKYQIIAFVLPMVFYLIHVVSYFYSENKKLAGFDLEVKIPLLLFPLLAIGTNSLYRLKRTVFLKIFVAGLIVASVACLIHSFRNSLHVIDGKMIFDTAISASFSHLNFLELINRRLSLFSYNKFSIFHHPAYFAMYLNFGVIAVYYLFRRAKKQSSKLIYVVIALFFSSVVYLLSSRAGLISLFLVFMVLLFIEVLLSKKLGIIAIAIAYLVVISIAVLNSRLNVNIESVLHKVQEKLNFTNDKNDSNNTREYTDPRLIIWHYSLEVVSENPVFGVGIGDIKENLYEKYKDGNFKSGVRNVFNAHNQYLESLMGGGVLLIMALMAFILYGLYMAVVRQRYMLGALVFIAAINMAFESMFNTMAGTIFIMFLYSMLVRFDNKSMKLKELKELKEVK